MAVTTTPFPDLVEEGNITSVWDDRIRDVWIAAGKDLSSTYNGDAFWAGVPADQLLKFGAVIAKHISFEPEVTSVRIVRYTNSGGYPVYRLDLAHGGTFKPRSSRRKDKFYDDDLTEFYRTYCRK
jgi:hypothetical protein